MQVIIDKYWSLNIDCHKCKFALLIDHHDISFGLIHPQISETNEDYDGSNYTFKYFVECYVCSSVIIINENILTPEIKRMAKYKRSTLENYGK